MAPFSSGLSLLATSDLGAVSGPPFSFWFTNLGFTGRFDRIDPITDFHGDLEPISLFRRSLDGFAFIVDDLGLWVMAKLPTCSEYLTRCIGAAVTDLHAKAELVKPLVGTGGLALVLWLMGHKTKLPESMGGQIIFDGASLIVSAGFVFLTRLAMAPLKLAREDASKLRALENEIRFLNTKPMADLRMNVDGGVVVEWNPDDPAGHSQTGFLANVKNEGQKTIRNCQLYLVTHPPLGYPHSYPISPSFDLKPGEDRHWPVIHWNEHDPDRRAFVSPSRDGNEALVHLLLAPGEYEIRVLADDNRGASLKVVLSTDHDFSKPIKRKWFLEPR